MFDFCLPSLGVAAAGLGEAARPPRSSAGLAPTAAAAGLPACRLLSATGGYSSILRLKDVAGPALWLRTSKRRLETRFSATPVRQ